MVCEKGGLQFVGLYEILTEKDTPATGVEDSDCVHYSNSRLHPVHRVGFLSTEPSALREHEGRGRYAKFAYAPRMAGGGYLQGMTV